MKISGEKFQSKMSYAPWFSEIFCQKYSENQKCATPLITATTWQSFPPRGSLDEGKFKTKCFEFRLCSCPSFVCYRRHLPPQGEAAKRLSIFAEKNEVYWIFFRQGEGSERQIHNEIFCRDFCVRQGARVTADGSVQIVRNRGGRKLDTVLRKKNAKN